MENKKTSTVCMTMVDSSGTWLNGALVPQHHYVSLTIEDPEGKVVARAALTFEQVTRMLMYNGDVVCTLERYRGEDGNLTKEEVLKPQTVHSRMNERLGESRKELKARIKDLYKDLYEVINGGGGGKKKLLDILSQIQTIQSHFESNDSFVLQQAEEELGTMQTQAACQLGVFLQSQGLNANPEKLQKLLPVSDEKLLTDKSKIKPVPIVTGYKPKQREEKNIDDMTAMEVSDNLFSLFKKFELTVPVENLYAPNSYVKGNCVIIRYISYQSEWTLSLEEAKSYLKVLKNAKQFVRHFTH